VPELDIFPCAGAAVGNFDAMATWQAAFGLPTNRAQSKKPILNQCDASI
jgi:hypothetical protein